LSSLYLFIVWTFYFFKGYTYIEYRTKEHLTKTKEINLFKKIKPLSLYQTSLKKSLLRKRERVCEITSRHILLHPYLSKVGNLVRKFPP
jgi:hypothetical protein